MTAPTPAPEALDAAIVGRDGALTLALAVAVAALGLGIPVLVRMIEVARAGWTAPTDAATLGGPIPGGHVLVLGARLPRSGRPGRAFRARLARARALRAAHPEAILVLLGGSERPGAITEAEAGRDWLLARGVAPAAIALERRSRHTLENLRCYRAGFAPPDAPAALVSSRCHLARAARMAAGLGVAVRPIAAETARAAALHPWALPREAFLLHWYAVGARFAALTGNRAMLARIG
ncbi:MAG: YdcF family protein [Rhodospirillales bacterium]|nr:YdcF family protein [Rhodospirillales bacterium]